MEAAMDGDRIVMLRGIHNFSGDWLPRRRVYGPSPPARLAPDSGYMLPLHLRLAPDSGYMLPLRPRLAPDSGYMLPLHLRLAAACEMRSRPAPSS
eukprot:255189-Pyramimonas_sp.AAC.1